LKICPICDGIIPDTATSCGRCTADSAAAVADVPVVAWASEMPVAEPPVEGPPIISPVTGGESRGIGLREVLLIAGAVIGSGAITLAVLSGRGSVAATGSVAPAAAPAVHPVPPPSAVVPGDAPGWIDNPALWAGDDRKGVALELSARHETQVWMKMVRPLLVVRCVARRTDVFVFTDSAIAMEAVDDNHTVRVALDGAPERTERWPDSLAHDALFAPDGAAFVADLRLARTLRFGYTPHNAAPVVAEFDVAGLAERLAPVAARCSGEK
jgi:hypothetical protein